MSGLALDTAQRNIQEAAEFIDMSKQELTEFREPEAYYHLVLDIGGTAASEIANVDELDAYIVIHNTILGRPRGGKTGMPGVDGSTVGAKGATMTVKNALDEDPEYQYGGAKAGVDTGERIARFLRDRKAGLDHKVAVIGAIEHQFVSEALEAGALSPTITDSTYTFAPDEGTNALWMSAAVDSMKTKTGLWVPALATGKPIEEGGVEGRGEATGRGLVDTLRNAIISDEKLAEKRARGEKITIGLQGYGNVGSYFHEVLEYEKQLDEVLANCELVAAADHTGTYFDESGLQIMDAKTRRGLEEAQGAPLALDFAAQHGFKHDQDSSKVLTGDFDVLITAAMANVVGTAEDVEEFGAETRFAVNADEVGAGIIIEGGNGCVTFRAQKRLEERGVKIYTGILANGGGSIVSWDEHNFGLRLMNDPNAQPPKLEETRENLRNAMDRRFWSVVNFAVEHEISIPTAANVIAMTHIRQKS